MSAIDVEQLLREVSTDSPCGDDLEYDAAFMAMARSAAGRPPQEMGAQVIAGEEPNWREVRDQCVSLCARTKDLRVAVFLTRSLARTDGLGGLASGLAFCRSLVERYWEGVHPRLDPDDNNDPTLRVNTLAGLSDRDQMITGLRMVPLANSRGAGRFGLRDVELANGTIARTEGADPGPTMAMIEAAFLDMDVAELQAVGDGVVASIDSLTGLDNALDMAVGAATSADFSSLKQTLKSMNVLLQQQLARRGLAAAAGDGSAMGGEAGLEPGTGGMPAMSGPIQSREDVIRMLDQVCDWYSRYEPSSPVPLLLVRAKRLVNKNFMELMQDMAPGGLNEVQTIAGSEGS